MIICSCNIIAKSAFEAAIKANTPEIEAAPTLHRAIGIIYRAAKSREGQIGQKENCTTCFHSVAALIQEAGHFQGETYTPKKKGSACNDGGTDGGKKDCTACGRCAVFDFLAR